MPVTAAQAGERHPFQLAPDQRQVTLQVLPPCDANRGHWVCLTHQQGFGNQLEKDFHIGRGDHRLVWICWEHGPEQPT
jgi:hypothetical protein